MLLILTTPVGTGGQTYFFSELDGVNSKREVSYRPRLFCIKISLSGDFIGSSVFANTRALKFVTSQSVRLKSPTYQRGSFSRCSELCFLIYLYH